MKLQIALRFSITLLVFSNAIQSQDIYKVKSGKISFFAGTPVEDIDAVNAKITGFFNVRTGDVIISMSNKDFIFKRSLMQEHFNENYMESEKYPKSDFKGKIVGIENYNLSVAGTYQVKVDGNLNVHGVMKPRKFDATIAVNEAGIEVDCKFDIALADHKIEIPKIVFQKIAEHVKTTLNLTYEPYKK
ncbi:MAG: YceI family protein [Cytophagales bacterium]